MSKMIETPNVWLVQVEGKSKSITNLFEQLGLFPRRVFSSFHNLRLALQKETPRGIFIQAFPGRSVIAEIQRLKKIAPHTHVLLLTSGDDVQALNAEISNLILETAAVKDTAQNSAKKVYDLSDREREILRLMVRGLINKEIAEELSISYFTVENHQRKIYDKLNVHTRTAAVTKVLLEKMI